VREKKISRKPGKSVVFGSTLLAGALLLQAAARSIPGFGQRYAVFVYPLLTGTAGRLFGILPFSVSELLLYLFLAGILVLLIRSAKRQLTRSDGDAGPWKRAAGRVLGHAFFLISFLFFLYTINCGINYYRTPFSDYLEYGTGRYSKEELDALCGWLTEQVNKAYAETGTQKVSRMQEAGVRAMEELGKRYPALNGSYPKPKPLLLSRILSVQQLSGIYSPFTIEANYNNEMTPYNIPHTICHELSHLKGFMREDEANFIGFLACIGSENAEFRYSGYLTAWIYAGNALAAEDIEMYSEYWQQLRPEIHKDLEENSDFWNRFESKVSEAAEAVNDHYLKANRQSDGVKSYGRMVDLMLAWYAAGQE